LAKKLAFDKVLFTTIMLLLGLGLVMVYSASAAEARQQGASMNPFLVKQCVAALLGLAAMAALMHVDYRYLRRPAITYALLLGVLVLLVAVLFAPPRNDVHRWLFVGGLSVQPSELAKLALIAFLAYQIDRKPRAINRIEFLLPSALAIAAIVGLILVEPDLSSALLLAMAAGVLLILTGISWRYLLGSLLLIVPVFCVTVLAVPYRLARLLSFLYPDREPLQAGYQPAQSLIAVGSGGALGRGLGNSVQKLHFLPYPHSDYIYAILAEELGLVGSVAVLALFAVFCWRGVKAGIGARDDLGRYLAWGLTSMVALQALLHISVALAVFPSTGVPLPLMTYGGSCMVATLAACGVVLNVSQHG
jgi:cell division protein FtsW